MASELDIRIIISILFKKIGWVIGGTIIGMMIMFVTSQFIMTPKYTSYITMYVNNLTSKETNVSVNLNDINASQKLVNTYIVLLKNDEILDQVSKKLSRPYSSDQLRSILSMVAVNNTEVLRIQAETDNPELSVEICNAISEIAPSILQRVVKAGSVEIIGVPKVPVSPSSPNVINFSAIGALLGLAASMFFIILMHVLDNTIKGEEDLKLYIDEPILGEIPSFENSSKGKEAHAK